MTGEGATTAPVTETPMEAESTAAQQVRSLI